MPLEPATIALVVGVAGIAIVAIRAIRRRAEGEPAASGGASWGAVHRLIEKGAVVRGGGDDWIELVVGGVLVRLELAVRKVPESVTTETWVVASPLPPRAIPPTLRLTPERLDSRLARAFGAQDLETGDPAFDRAFRVQGEEPYSRAALAAKARRSLLRGVPGWSLDVTDGAARIGRSDLLELSARIVPDVEALVAIAAALAMTAREIPGRLAESASEDPEPVVRARCGELLLSAYSRDPSTLGFARRASATPGHLHRLAAAGALGSEGIAVLAALAANPEEGNATRRGAADALARVAPEETLTRFVVERLGDSDAWAIHRELLEAIVARGLHGAVAALGGVEVERVEADTAASLARFLGARRDPAAEAALLRLSSHSAFDVRIEAVRALGTAGGVSAVARLHAVAHGLLEPLALKSAARDAIAAIQSRLSGAEAGQLSVADAADGRGGLSPARDEAGGLSELPGTGPGGGGR